MLGSNILTAALLLLSTAEVNAQSTEGCSAQATQTVTVHTSLNDGPQTTSTRSASSQSTQSALPVVSEDEAVNGTEIEERLGTSGPVAPPAGSYRNAVYFTNW